MKKITKKTVVMGLAIMLLAGCSGKSVEIEQQTKKEETENTEKERTIKIGLIVGTGGLGDQNFNDKAYSGLEQAKEKYGIEFDYSEPQSASDYATYITQYAEDGSYDLIMLNASEAESALTDLAPKYPEQKFTIIDTEVKGDNIMSFVKDFRDYTFLGGYLAGVLTTDTSLNNINDQASVGIVIGVDSPVMQNGALGFMAGAKLANPENDVRVGIVGSFGDPAMAKEITKSLYDNGADIVMTLSGGSGLGVINQAKESNLYAIGCTINQNGLAPDHVASSAVENLDVAVLQTCEKLLNGEWEGGVEYLSIVTGYFDLVFEDSNVAVPKEVQEKIREIYKDIQLQKLKLPETREEIDDWVIQNNEYAFK